MTIANKLGYVALGFFGLWMLGTVAAGLDATATATSSVVGTIQSSAPVMVTPPDEPYLRKPGEDGTTLITLGELEQRKITQAQMLAFQVKIDRIHNCSMYMVINGTGVPCPY